MKLKTLAEIFQEHKNPKSVIKQLTPEQALEKAKKKKKPNKYRNKWVVIDNINFQSEGEGYYWLDLKARMNNGEFREIKRQVRFKLYAGDVYVREYVADFVTLDWNGNFQVIDYKSQFTARLPTYQMKKQLMLACYGVVIMEPGLKK
jgi:hypothetical protein